MRTLVLGANGLLGSNVVAAALDREWDVHGTVRSDTESAPCSLARLDVRDAERAADIIDERSPDVVVNCTAMTDVDGCEDTPEQAHAVNGEAPGALAETCADRDVPFVHVSTDYVFDGRASTPYAESAEPNPIQVYGESKLAGERAVQDSATETLLVRLSFVYGTHGFTGDLTGFPAWVRDALTEGQSVPLFTDQRVTPSRAGRAATAILDLADAGARGRFHVASRSCLTPFEFGEMLAERIEVDPSAAERGDDNPSAAERGDDNPSPAERVDVDPSLVEEGSMDDVDRAADRPQYTCLDVSKVESTLGRAQPSVEADLTAIEDSLVP